MRRFLAIMFCLILVGMLTSALAQRLHKDPQSLTVMSAENPIVLDGRLDETDWQRRIFHTNFRAGFTPDDGSYVVTGSLLVTEGLTGTLGYTDTSSAQVFLLHYGTDLYIGVRSTDSSICKRWGSWEGDGLFTKVNNKAGTAIEYKLMFNSDVDTSHAIMETSGNAPANSSEGASYLFPGSIASNNAAKDSGYSEEMIIHLDKLGYTATDSVMVLVTVMEPDSYTRTQDEGSAPAVVQFYKSWWGSEWGGGAEAYRTLYLADKPVVDAYKTDNAITLDGRLMETEWANAQSVTLGPNSKDATNWWYMQWGDTLASYDDRSTTVVKMLHKGTDLYLGFVSDDNSVCNWSAGWEADGPFIYMRDKFTVPAPGSRQEVKLMFFGDSVGGPAQFQVNTNVPTDGAEGVAYTPPGTVTRTETNGADAGYTGEVIIHGDKWGYVDGDTIRIDIVLWDMDRSSKDVTAAHQSIYAKSWWGSEWADTGFDKFFMYRGIYLSPQLVVGVNDPTGTAPRTFALDQNYPNPFNPETEIRYQIPHQERVTLKIYNLLGKEVATLVDEARDPGEYVVRWDGRNSAGTVVSSGVYFCRIQAGPFTDVRKMAFVK